MVPWVSHTLVPSSLMAGSKNYMMKTPNQVLCDWTRVKIVTVFNKTGQHSSGYGQRWAERIWNGQYSPSLVPLRSTMLSTKCNLSESPSKSWSILICEQTYFQDLLGWTPVPTFAARTKVIVDMNHLPSCLFTLLTSLIVTQCFDWLRFLVAEMPLILILERSEPLVAFPLGGIFAVMPHSHYLFAQKYIYSSCMLQFHTYSFLFLLFITSPSTTQKFESVASTLVAPMAWAAQMTKK